MFLRLFCSLFCAKFLGALLFNEASGRIQCRICSCFRMLLDLISKIITSYSLFVFSDERLILEPLAFHAFTWLWIKIFGISFVEITLDNVFKYRCKSLHFWICPLYVDRCCLRLLLILISLGTTLELDHLVKDAFNGLNALTSYCLIWTTVWASIAHCTFRFGFWWGG